ncbi:hypothetical protein CN084_28070 [Sinorhizobium medicae]|nr:hypothetical protein CN084_28070 [Sinorhizobium medicae]
MSVVRNPRRTLWSDAAPDRRRPDFQVTPVVSIDFNLNTRPAALVKFRVRLGESPFNRRFQRRTRNESQDHARRWSVCCFNRSLVYRIQP